jgi:serine/threonine protein phosphatase PrpC
MNVKLHSGKITDPGGREENQDYCNIRERGEETPALFQFIVADGLGGQGGGALASKSAVLKMLVNDAISQPQSVNLSEYFDTDRLALSFDVAHDHIKHLQQAGNSEYSRMATTMTVLMIMDGKAIWGHVGDSRLYLFRNGAIYHQTKDHSVPQMLVSSGEIQPEDIRHHPDRNRLLRALGDNREKIQARVHDAEPLQEGDAFLLCSDGFWEYITEEQMLSSLSVSASPDGWLVLMKTDYLLPAVEEERKQAGLEKAENDNYTAVAVWYGNKPSMPQLVMPSAAAIPQGFREQAKATWDDFKIATGNAWLRVKNLIPAEESIEDDLNRDETDSDITEEEQKEALFRRKTWDEKVAESDAEQKKRIMLSGGYIPKKFK